MGETKSSNAKTKKVKKVEKVAETETKKVVIKTLSGTNLKKIFIGGYNLLDKNKAAIDALNVFPVPDGDTGLNMSLTMKSVIKETENINTNNIVELTEGISRGALKGARGNSGVITSQILKGMMSVLGKIGDSKLTTWVFAKAMREGAKVAYSAVTVPKEGTILTVIRVMGEKAEKIAGGTSDFIEFFQRVIEEGEIILAQTPDMLPVLKKAGVIDAGGRGLITIFRGFLATLDGSGDIELRFDRDTAVIRDTADEIADIEDISEIEFAYCTEFFVVNMKKTTTMASIDAFRDKLVLIGDSVICVGDLQMVKVHIHTNTPNTALGYALDIGEITKIKIENMLEQNRELRASRNMEDKAQGMVVVANGEGINALFKELSVDFIIKGGQTMNPSAQEIATAVDRVHAKTVFVFPNNKNIILAAMNAQSLTNKNIVVIPTKSINEGISAAISFSPDCSVEENTQNFIAATNSVVSASVTYAVRSANIDGMEIKEGDIIGLDEKGIVAKGKNPDEVAEKLVTKLIRDNFASVTLFFGEGVKESAADNLAKKLQNKFANCEVTPIDGGQSVYYYLISLE